MTLDAAVGKINDYDKLIVKNGSGVNLDVDHQDNAAGNVDIWFNICIKWWYFRILYPKQC